MENLIILVLLGLILGGAAGYVYKSKKKGVKCIGCPDGSKCGGACSGYCGCSQDK
jgi:LPXTG-motif cell wall-anchored protein